MRTHKGPDEHPTSGLATPLHSLSEWLLAQNSFFFNVGGKSVRRRRRTEGHKSPSGCISGRGDDDGALSHQRRQGPFLFSANTNTCTHAQGTVQKASSHQIYPAVKKGAIGCDDGGLVRWWQIFLNSASTWTKQDVSNSPPPLRE